MVYEIGIQRATGDVAIGTSGKPQRVFWIHLVSGSSASTTSLRNGTSSSDTANIQVDGVANQGVTLNFAGGAIFPAGCFLDADANISYALVGFGKEV